MRAKKKRYKPRFFIIIAVFVLLAAFIVWRTAFYSGNKKLSAEASITAEAADETYTGEQESKSGNANKAEARYSEPDAAGESSAAEAPASEPAPKSTTPESAYPLSTADGDILVLVNKTHPVTEDYKADDLVKVESCDPDIGTPETRTMRKEAASAFETLASASREAGFNIVMRTGYRSYSYQDSLFRSYAEKYGEENANTYSARPGQSEHQTGWCCDVGVRGRSLSSFDGSTEAEWIAGNCYKYGFILRYPEGKTDITGYIYESWHIRYVGLQAAEIIYNNNLTLEEYLESDY